MMSEGNNGLSIEDLSLYNDEAKKKEKVVLCNGGYFSTNSNLFATNLTHLKLSNSNLTQFPSDIPNSDSIVEIDLSNNKLNDLPDSFISFKKLRVLNLSNNNINKIPQAFYQGLYLVKTLNLSYNNLVTFHKAPCCLTFLQNLDLSFNKLVTPPSWLTEEHPTCLEFIDLSCNGCFQLCPVYPEVNDNSRQILKVADAIKTLKMCCCGIKGGVNEKYLAHFSQVSSLDISNHLNKTNERLNFLSDVYYLPENITELSMINVGLACLPKGICNLSKLRSLDISKNIIQWFPPTVKNLKNLVILRADKSKIFLLPPEMNELPALKELYLSENEMSSWDGFEDLVTLEVLDLYGNQFITVPKFENLSRLRALDFCQNYIEPPKFITLGKRLCSYESLRDCLRSKYVHQKNRANGAKDFPVIPENDDCYDTGSEFDDYVDAEDGETSDNASSHASGKAGEYYEGEPVREIWDVDSDENYDPNEMNRNMSLIVQRASPTESLTGELPYEVKLHPHYFAPYRSITPVVLPEEDLPPPVEGQFDD